MGKILTSRFQEVVHASLHLPFGQKNIRYFRSKASIFLKVDVLLTSACYIFFTSMLKSEEPINLSGIVPPRHPLLGFYRSGWVFVLMGP